LAFIIRMYHDARSCESQIREIGCLTSKDSTFVLPTCEI